jgi:hypothetical protein
MTVFPDISSCTIATSHRHFGRACCLHYQGSKTHFLDYPEVEGGKLLRTSIITNVHGVISQNTVTFKVYKYCSTGCGIKREDREELGQGTELARSLLLLRQLKVNRRMWRDGGGTRPTASNKGTPLLAIHTRTNTRSLLRSLFPLTPCHYSYSFS